MYPVRIQVGIKARVPKGIRFTKSFLDEVIKGWFVEKQLPKGIRIVFIQWIHPGERRGRKADTPVELNAARERFRGLLQSGSLKFRTIRGG